MMNYIEANLQSFEQSLRQRCADNQLRIGEIVRRYDALLQGSQPRNAAKDVTERLIAHIEQRTQRSADVVREQLCGVFANSAWDQYRADIMQLFGPMV
jgi:hypothetical protein